MPGDYDDQLSCVIGPGTSGAASFTVCQYNAYSEPQIKEGLGRVGTRRVIKARGYVAGATEAALVAAMDLLKATAEGANAGLGGDVVVLGRPVAGGGGGERFRIVASVCAAGWPKVVVTEDTAGEYSGAGRLHVELAAEGVYGISDDWDAPDGAPLRVTVDEDTDADEREVVTRRGVAGARRVGANFGGLPAMEVFRGVVLPAFRRDYPPVTADGAPGWVVKYKLSREEGTRPARDARTVEYTLTAERLTQKLPRVAAGAGGDGGGAAVDGTVTYGYSRDDANRATDTVTYDLLLAAGSDPVAVSELLRPAGEDLRGGAVVGETYSESWTKGLRIRGTYTVLRPDDGAGPLDWQNELQFSDENNFLAAKGYPGIGPVLYRPADTGRVARQSGRAVGIGAYPPPAPPAFGAEHLSAPGRFTRRRIDAHQRETAWEYDFLFARTPGFAEMQAALASLDPPAPTPEGGAA